MRAVTLLALLCGEGCGAWRLVTALLSQSAKRGVLAALHTLRASLKPASTTRSEKRPNPDTAMKKVLLFALAACFTHAAFAQASFEWRAYGGDAGGRRFSPLKEITRENVARLARAWTYHTGEIDPAVKQGRDGFAFQCTPLVVGGVMYLSTPLGRVVALDAETGKELWVHDPRLDLKRVPNYPRSRGVAYWESRSRGGAEKRVFFGTNDGRLIALDAATGRPCAGFGAGGAVDLRAGVADDFKDEKYMVTSPPAVFKDLVIVGGARLPENTPQGPRGDVRAFDARTGELVWTFHTIPRPGEFGYDTWPDGAGKNRTGVNAWGPLSVDEGRGLLFVPLGAPAYDHYGGDRKGANLFANCVVALDAATGRRRWHYQVVHHDIWDYDIPAQPALITVRRGGRSVPAVAVLTKSGFVFVFDRVTGRPLIEIKEQPVPRSAVPGEESWPTQPMPVGPPQLVRNKITRDEITNVTPESRKYCLALFDTLEHPGGAYQPFGTKPTLRFPGTLGGATWSGASFDPATGLLYTNVNELGTYGRVAPPNEPRAAWPKRFWDANEWPCQQPPWGKLVAVDVNTGRIRWDVPLGVVEELAAKGVTNTGAPNLGGSIVTAGGLVFIGGSNDKRFRAFDAATGKVLWEAKLEGSGHATPVSYRGRKSGRQFVVIAAGGGGYLSRHSADAVVAFALPAPAESGRRARR
jgi:glucose dehydrogenase